jgi:hypothetical protein
MRSAIQSARVELGIRAERLGRPVQRSVDAGTSGRQPAVSMRKPVFALIIVLALLAAIRVATAGKDCHFNVHLSKRVYCTNHTSPANDDSAPRPGQGP